MIFVILGTQKFQFNRLLEMVDDLIEKKVITEPVFAQTGFSTYRPKHYKYRDFLEEKDFKEKIGESRFVISHGGIGSMMSCLEKNKRVIVVPRKESHHEHIDNHQYQLASLFVGRGHVLIAENEKQLTKAVEEIDLFHPVPYKTKSNHIEQSLDRYISTKEVEHKPKVLMVGSDLSVRGGIVSVIKNLLEFDGWSGCNLIFVPTHVEGSALKKMIFFLKGLHNVKKAIRRHKVKLVHIHVSERGSFIRKACVLRAAKRKGCQVILHHHGAEFEQYYQEAGNRHKKFIAKTLGKADLNIVLSERLIPTIRDVNPQARVKVLYNSVAVHPVNRYNINARGILMLGRLEQRKGTFDLLETIAAIDGKLPEDVVFYLCGDGDLTKVREAIERLNIGHRIAHVGWVDGEQKKEFLKNSMCHILFSYNEGLPMAILETMGYGILNISTNIASIPEVVKNDETGILLEPGDRKALGEAILRVVSDENYRKGLSECSHRLIYEKFSLENGVKILESYYKELQKK